jgi:hypothetical protein
MAWAELLCESLRPATLVPHREKVQRGGQKVQVREGQAPGSQAFQVVTEPSRGFRPAKADFVELLHTNMRKIQAGLNCQPWKTGIVFESADALLRHREKQFAVTDNTSRRIVHPRIVYA